MAKEKARFDSFSRPCRIFETLEECNVLVALVSRHLLAFFGFFAHDSHTFVSFLLGFGYTLERWVGVQMFHHPVVKILNVGNCVDDTAWS